MRKIYIAPMTSVIGQVLATIPINSGGKDQNKAQAPGYRGIYDDTEEEEEDW